MILGERSAEFVSFDFFLYLPVSSKLRVLSIFCVEGSEGNKVK